MVKIDTFFSLNRPSRSCYPNCEDGTEAGTVEENIGGDDRNSCRKFIFGEDGEYLIPLFVFSSFSTADKVH